MGKDPQNDKAMANDHKDHKENLERPLSTTIRQKVSTKRIKLPLNTFFAFSLEPVLSVPFEKEVREYVVKLVGWGHHSREFCVGAPFP